MTNDPIVTCCHCKAQFEGFSDTQANDCAADVKPDGIYGHYGSAVADLQVLPYAEGSVPASLTLDGQICDPCIVKMQESGVLGAGTDRTMAPLTETPDGLVEIDCATRHVRRWEDLDPASAQMILEEMDAQIYGPDYH